MRKNPAASLCPGVVSKMLVIVYQNMWNGNTIFNKGVDVVHEFMTGNESAHVSSTKTTICWYDDNVFDLRYYKGK